MEFSPPSYSYKLIKRKNQKYLRIRISRQGEVLVSAPESMPDKQIQGALVSRESWVKKHLSAFSKDLESFDPLQFISINGSPLKVERSAAPSGRRGRIEFLPDEGLCRIYSSDTREEPCLTLLEKHLKKTAARVLKDRLETISLEIRIPFKTLSIRNQQTRWGSSSGRGNISLNWRILMLPPVLQDYLIIHELCHQRHFNHSAVYWKTVEKFCSDYKVLNKSLKKYHPFMALFRRPSQPPEERHDPHLPRPGSGPKVWK